MAKYMQMGSISGYCEPEFQTTDLVIICSKFNQATDLKRTLEMELEKSFDNS